MDLGCSGCQVWIWAFRLDLGPPLTDACMVKGRAPLYPFPDTGARAYTDICGDTLL